MSSIQTLIRGTPTVHISLHYIQLRVWAQVGAFISEFHTYLLEFSVPHLAVDICPNV